MAEWTAHVITVSDGVHGGSRRDESGDVLARMLGEEGAGVSRSVVPDERARISDAIRAAASTARLVVTTGGTGLGPRDVTPEATLDVLDRSAPGLVHLMLARGLEATPMAALSRAAAGTAGGALVINLPGSPRGAAENLTALLPVLPHALDLVAGDTEHR
ncbi:MAG: MogA/MoaB family molybdenum cofactor biosynthesis protein [Actinomycetota bacterium]